MKSHSADDGGLVQLLLDLISIVFHRLWPLFVSSICCCCCFCFCFIFRKVRRRRMRQQETNETLVATAITQHNKHKHKNNTQRTKQFLILFDAKNENKTEWKNKAASSQSFMYSAMPAFAQQVNLLNRRRKHTTQQNIIYKQNKTRNKTSE